MINKKNSCYGFINLENKKDKGGKIITVKNTIRDNITDMIKNIKIINDDDDGFYTCKVDNIKSLVTILNYNYPIDIIEYVSNRKVDSFTCPIDNSNKKYTYSYVYNNYTVDSFVDKINTGILDEFTYLDNINANNFYFNHENFVIIPNLSHYLLDNTDINKYNNINDIQQKIEFLSKISFILYLKDPDEKYKSIYDFTSSDIELLERVRDGISFFLEKLVGRKLTKKNYYQDVYVKNMNKYIKHNLIMIDFGVFDFTKFYKYDSYIYIYQRYNLDDLIYVLKGAGRIVNYLKIDSDYRYVDRLCRGKNPLYDLYKNKQKYTGGGLSELEDLIKDFEVINEFSKNILHNTPYCSIFVLLKSRGKYYNLHIKTITVDYITIKSNTKDQQEYINQILKQEIDDNLISNYKIDRITEKKYNMKLPTFLSIYIKKYDKNPLEYFYYAIETKEQYNDVLDILKRKTPDISIILHNIHINLLITNNCLDNPESLPNKKIVNLINQHYFLSYIIHKKHYFSKNKNFFIINAVHLNPDYYLLWYFPKTKIINIDKYIELLELCVDIQNSYNQNLSDNHVKHVNPEIDRSLLSIISNISNVKLISLIKQCCNFLDLYQVNRESKFMYNIRHKTPEYIDEIDNLLYEFYYNKGIGHNLIAYAHYPVASKNNIFHLHITEYYTKNKSAELLDHAFLYKYSYLNRNYIWNVAKYIDFSKKTMYVSYGKIFDEKNYIENFADIKESLIIKSDRDRFEFDLL